jgi:hypothetical protein
MPTTPTDYTFNSAAPSCTSVFTSVTLSCTYTSGTKILKVSGMFPSVNADGQYGIIISNFFTGAAAVNSTSFSMTIKNPTGYLIVQQTTGIISKISAAVGSCSSPCATCAGTASTCTSCTVPSDNPIFNPVT